MKLTGYAAIAYAEKNNATLSKYADPIEGASDGLSVEEAKKIAADDPALIYVVVKASHVMRSRRH